MLAFLSAVYAEVNFGTQTPSANQVIEALNPADDYEGDVKKGPNDKERLIDMKTLYDFNPKSTPYTPKNTDTTVSLEIKFDYNTAELTEDAKKQLKPVGEAFASKELSSLTFVLEGHTDAIGSQAYNKTLSEARAASVKHFLVNTFNLQAANIQIVGKGKEGLLDYNNPASEVNRRVRIIARK
jgi:outer membrane protein OmpA-like peptidoglycan-associated protein